MWDEFLSNQNMMFMIALCIFAAITILELIGTILGFSSISQDFDVDVDMDHHLHFDGDFSPHGFLNWLGFGRIPVMAFIALASVLFGVIGLIINHIALGFLGSQLHALIAVPIAFVGTLPLLAKASFVVAKLLPRDESNAILMSELIGREATITSTASYDVNSSAYAYDEYGTLHNFSVRTLSEGVVIPANSKVRLEHLSDQGVFLVSPIG
jgi:membrane protein implicated in regulation of membrane protease activity